MAGGRHHAASDPGPRAGRAHELAAVQPAGLRPDPLERHGHWGVSDGFLHQGGADRRRGRRVIVQDPPDCWGVCARDRRPCRLHGLYALDPRHRRVHLVLCHCGGARVCRVDDSEQDMGLHAQEGVHRRRGDSRGRHRGVRPPAHPRPAPRRRLSDLGCAHGSRLRRSVVVLPPRPRRLHAAHHPRLLQPRHGPLGHLHLPAGRRGEPDAAHRLCQPDFLVSFRSVVS
mmetsp:Transcript_48963/g.122363  ORF Transcript_48963/g.122363 Transcript_48963/m.122363 type:complete len:228 (+) Transcript_48963:903-1586(+)